MKALFPNLFPGTSSAGRDWLDIWNLFHSYYSEVHRHYHNLNHISEMLTFRGKYIPRRDKDNKILISILFHDLIYDPQSKENEIMSAKICSEILRDFSYPESITKGVSDFIYSTIHHIPKPDTEEVRLFLDFDLLILGSSPERYEEYSNSIRKEYSFVNDEDYKTGRSRILENFLKRDRIFFDDVIRSTYEMKARENLESELKILTQTSRDSDQ
ncbi:MAG: hypothetical protein KDK54_13060 [Leptospiraceae bacterium]|nr:hypothetical protein [Leptospiraceae bacterium]